MSKYYLKDPAIHGSPLIPLEVYHQDYLYGGLAVPYHWHKEWEWIWVEKGKMNLTIAGKRVTAQKNDILFINSTELHGINSIKKSASIHHAIVFSPQILSGKYSDQFQLETLGPLIANQFQFNTLIEASKSQKYLPFFKKIVNAHQKKEKNWYFFVKINLMEILYLLINDNKIFENNTAINHLVNFSDVIVYIHQNYMKKINIDNLANQANISKGHFIRQFHEEMGLTPIEYLNNFRIYKATKLLEKSSYNVTEICYSCGFNNLSYFIKVFKEKVGISPKQYALKHHRKEGGE